MTNRERVADFLALNYSDCNLLSLPETANPFSGQATARGYLRDADHICRLLGVNPDAPVEK